MKHAVCLNHVTPFLISSKSKAISHPNSVILRIQSSDFKFVVPRYLQDYDETAGKVSSEDYILQKTQLKSQAVAWNPLAAYHMIRRFSTDLKALLKSLDLSNMVHLSKFCRNHEGLINTVRYLGEGGNKHCKTL